MTTTVDSSKTGIVNQANVAITGGRITGTAVVLNSLPQMLGIVCGNSITALSRWNSGGYWQTNAELHIANQLAGAPLRFQRMAISGGTAANWNASVTGVCDIWGVYGYSGAALDTINADIETNWLAPVITAGNVPQIVIGLSLLENDIANGATVAQMTARLKIWMAMVRRWGGDRLLIATPRPSYSYDTALKVANYQTMRDYILALDDGASLFASRLDGYENPASPGTPLAGYTDASVHPLARGAWVNGRVLAATLRRIAMSFQFPYRVVSNNYALTGSTSVSGGTNIAAGSTGPTSSVASGAASAGAQTVTLAAEDPGWLITVAQNAGVNVDCGTWTTGAVTYAGGANTQVSTLAEVEVVSGAEFIRWIGLRARINDGSGNNFQNFINQQTSDGDGAYQNGDVLTLLIPPQIAASGNITAISPYISAQAKTGGSSTNALTAGTFSLRVRRTGPGIVVA